MSSKANRTGVSSKNSLFLVSLGCSKNLVDTEVIAGTMLTAGYTLVFDPEAADLYVINSCAFIPAARQEAEEAIAEGIEWKQRAPGRRLVVAGCLPQWDTEKTIRRKYPEVDLWTGVNQIAKIAELLALPETSTNGGRCDFAHPAYLYDDTTPRLQLTQPHLAYLKIADGCNNRCTYCSIPNIRGVLRSRPLSSVVREAENLLAGGVKELLLIAQDITAYGADRPESGENLARLLREVTKLEGDFVLRLLYTHPAHYSAELIDLLSEGNPKILPYLDIPLQHISERILKAMHRHVSGAEIRRLLDELRNRIPDLVLRTTFITGFPGESDAEFEELRMFAKEYRFERCGVFPYSPEPGTPASVLPDQVPQEIAEKRAAALMKQQRSIMRRANRQWIGREVRVLIDEVAGKQAIGHAWMDAPEIDNQLTFFNAAGLKSGMFCKVKITDADSYDLFGEAVRETKGRKK